MKTSGMVSERRSAPASSRTRPSALRRTKGSTKGSTGLSSGLGVFSIGLGIAEIVAPGPLARFLGIRPRPLLFRMLGAREIANGIAILAQPKSSAWLWTRVAGDAMDLSLLGGALLKPGPGRARAAAATAAVVGITLLDAREGTRLAARRDGTLAGDGPIRAVVTIDRPAAECYRAWRNLEELPRYMSFLESVQDLGSGRSRWTARVPGGKSLDWETRIVDEKPDERLSWRSVPDSKVVTSGSVTFTTAPAGRGTIVRLEMEWKPPGGAAGRLAARAFGAVKAEQDLRRFKQWMETRQIITTQGQPHGPRPAVHRLLQKGESS